MVLVKKILMRESTFYVALGFFLIVRIAYALSRDLFPSGPDAPKYMKAPLDLVEFGFWSNQIEGAPTYPLGYPVVLWPLAKIGGSNWISLAQLLQIFLSIATVFLVYRISQVFFKRQISLLISYVFLFSPAFTPMSGQAMYEPLLMFLFYSYLLSIFSLQNFSRNPSWCIPIGFLAGIAIVTHPRIIPWILFSQLILYGKFGLKKSLVIFSSLLPIVLLFLSRNKVAHDSWTLSDAADSWISDIRPENFSMLVRDGVVNAIYFWSPFSGDAKRGTWMHNFTFYHEIKKMTESTNLVFSVAVVLGVAAFSLWLLGSFLLLKDKLSIGRFVLFIPLFTWGTDMLTVGDSRHRLVVVPLLLIGQVYAFIWLRSEKSNLLEKLNFGNPRKPNLKISD
jgi:hypothetical protein